jgi:hypothetical protein
VAIPPAASTGRPSAASSSRASVDAALQAGRDVVAAGERQQQVGGQRPAGRQLARPAQLGGEAARVRRQADGAQPAGRRHGRGQPGARQAAAHPGLHDGPLEPQPLGQLHPAILAEIPPTAASRERVVNAGGRAAGRTKERRVECEDIDWRSPP